MSFDDDERLAELQMTEQQKTEFLHIEQQTKRRRLQLEAMTREMRGSVGIGPLPAASSMAQIAPTDVATSHAQQLPFGGYEADDIRRSLRQFNLASAGDATPPSVVDAEGAARNNAEDDAEEMERWRMDRKTTELICQEGAPLK